MRALFRMEFRILGVMVAMLVVVKAQVYTDRYDAMNVDEVLANKRLLTAYVKCIMDQGRCTPEGKELKSHITEALQNGCEKCTETQKQSIRKVIGHLMNNEKDRWTELVQKYDPNGSYSQKYENELKLV